MYRNKVMGKKNFLPFDMPLLNVRLKPSVSAPQTVNVEEIEREAYEKGFEAGEKAGFGLGEQKAAVLIDRLEKIIRELAGLREQVIREIEPQFIELAVGMARKIILKELTATPDQIVEMTKEALARLERGGQIVIKINSSLYSLFMKHKEEILNIHPDIVFDVDPSASHLGSVVMSPAEDVVTDLDVQLRNLIKEMGERLHGD